MKSLFFGLISGLILLYFINIATLKTAIPNMEWIIHASIRFVAGFLVLGFSYFYAKALSFKKALTITLIIVLLDYIYDFYFEDYRFKLEIILHGIFMLTWGGIMGFLAGRFIHKR